MRKIVEVSFQEIIDAFPEKFEVIRTISVKGESETEDAYQFSVSVGKKEISFLELKNMLQSLLNELNYVLDYFEISSFGDKIFCYILKNKVSESKFKFEEDQNPILDQKFYYFVESLPFKHSAITRLEQLGEHKYQSQNLKNLTIKDILQIHGLGDLRNIGKVTLDFLFLNLKEKGIQVEEYPIYKKVKIKNSQLG